MVDLARFTGTAHFGSAYKVMLENYPCASWTIDRWLGRTMVWVCNETADCLYRKFTPTSTTYRKGTRPELERVLAGVIGSSRTPEVIVQAVAGFTRDLNCPKNTNIEDIVFGGTEEEIIARKSDFCGEHARVACALLQVAGVPSRIVILADTATAYSGHVMVEAFRSGKWGAVDSSTCVLYTKEDGEPATTWELMRQPELIERQFKEGATPFSTRGQFRAAAISNYPLEEVTSYCYETARVNYYYRAILAMCDRGWPGGIRWLFGENSEGSPPT
jgi:transglutaminase-like putative cysteine protease